MRGALSKLQAQPATHPAVQAALEEHRGYLMSETLASAWRKPAAGEFVAKQELGDVQWVITLAREPGAA